MAFGGLGSGQLLQRASEQNDNTCSAVAEEGEFQIARVFDFAAKLTKLVRRRVDGLSSEIRKRDLNAETGPLRIANVQQLSGDDEAVVLAVRFQMEVNLMRVGPIEHLPYPHGTTSGTRAHAHRGRLTKAVK